MFTFAKSINPSTKVARRDDLSFTVCFLNIVKKRLGDGFELVIEFLSFSSLSFSLHFHMISNIRALFVFELDAFVVTSNIFIQNHRRPNRRRRRRRQILRPRTQ